ncbi:unnamed protein product, partial [Polarella glacialis]
SDIERIRLKESSFLGQENLTDTSMVCGIPGLRDIRNAVAEANADRSEESRRAQDRLREYVGSGTSKSLRRSSSALSKDKNPLQSPSRGGGGLQTGVLDGLRGCEAALMSMDKRITNLEDCWEDKIYNLIRGDLTKSAALQKGQLQEMEQKVSSLLHTFHTPSGHQAAHASAAPGDRELWRQQFRSALGDSLYVKKALHKGSRSISTNDLRHA